MADTYTFVPPAWLEDQDAETIHERMMENLPSDIDDTEGGFPWDFTKPTALEKAELLEFNLMETAKLMHHMFSYGVYLDYHAAAAGTERKSASCASGTLEIVGSPSTVIPAGFQFAVPASGDTAAIIFQTLEEVTIDTDGKATVAIEAVEAGTNGNVAADTIVIMASPTITGITSITNPEATSGGAEEEDDDSLRERISEIYNSDASFVGCDADYKRWAKEVDGVGEVIVIPEWDGAGTVKIVVMDANGEPANEQIIEAVYDYIVSPDDRDARLAPIGATVTVVAPTTLTIDIVCAITIDADATYTTVYEAIQSGIEEYFTQAQEEGTIKKNKVGSIIIGTDGVNDYSTLTLNGSTANITVAQDEYPEIGTLTLEAAISTQEV
ncbi:MAG: baseplate J/gp47 family protein [Clostridia bacterium]|nr:baseplate J/gp47 family protein [Clostridia bacterium]